LDFWGLDKGADLDLSQFSTDTLHPSNLKRLFLPSLRYFFCFSVHIKYRDAERVLKLAQ
jgi:hypothetical protein